MVLGPAAGRLLIATGGLADPNFSRTVVLLLDHDSTGTLGVVLNRPTAMAVAEALPSWAGLTGPPSVLFQGGPVGLDSALALATLAAVPVDAAAGPVGWRGVVGTIGMIDLDAGTENLGPALRELRVYAGYAGWGPNQLDAELAGGAWIVVDSEPGDAFCTDPDKLWSRVWRRQPGEQAFVSTRPEDPTQN
ncbi:MAG TPA: YqgE/AlgH family protein [Sporichthyaceae bacterium]|jgi:putative transcriptional regulator